MRRPPSIGSHPFDVVVSGLDGFFVNVFLTPGGRGQQGLKGQSIYHSWGALGVLEDQINGHGIKELHGAACGAKTLVEVFVCLRATQGRHVMGHGESLTKRKMPLFGERIGQRELAHE